MKIKTVKLLVVASLASLALLLAASTYALTPAPFQAANLVLGQANFTSDTTGRSDKLMSSPEGVAVDPNGGKVFVADTDNNRVLRFASGAALVSGAPAEVVLGQADFTSNITLTSASKMDTPTGVFVDASGELWVADYGNNRVLRFDDASGKTNGAPADVVLGQPDFDGFFSGITNGMDGPYAVFVTADRVWVADANNNRVLRFGTTSPTGDNAGAVLGQPDFDTNTALAGAGGMNFPVGLFEDAMGQLWVADSGNHRVLRFNDAVTKPPDGGGSADGVLGQTNFDDFSSGITQSGMNGPAGVSGDAAGRLWVSDYGNNRVLWFDAAVAKADTDGGPADGVLGQPGFISVSANNGGRSAQSLAGPTAVFYHLAADVLWVADYGNNRVLRYGAPPEMAVLGNNVAIADGATTPAAANHTDFGTVTLGQALTRTFTISNSGAANLSLSGAPLVALSGAAALDFSLVVSPTTPVGPNATTNFAVRFTPSIAGLRVVTVTIANNDPNENPYDFAIQGTGSNQAPVANAGPDQTVSRTASVTLNGSASSDADGHTPLTYQWTQSGGSPVTLSSATVAQPTFNAPGVATVLTFNLTVTDAFGLADATPDTVVVTVMAAPEIAVLGNNGAIGDGATTPAAANHTDFGNLTLGQALTRTFTISNSGAANLSLSGAPPVTLSGASDFSVVQPTTSLLAPNTTTPFQVRFSPSVAGLRTVTVTIANNDSNENPYNFAIQGMGILAQKILTVTKLGAGLGTVTSEPQGINCGVTCTVASHAFNASASVKLTASAAAGSTFGGWSGDPCTSGGAGICTVTMNGPKSVNATFNLVGTVAHALKVEKGGNGFGRVTSEQAGIDCDETCPSASAAFKPDVVVTLTATPATGSTFVGWSNACTGTGSCQVTMSVIRTVIANFNTVGTLTQKLTMNKTGNGAGTVTSTPPGIDCSATCDSPFVQNAEVTLTASHFAGSTFGGWSDACTGTGTCVVTMSEARKVSATFNKATYQLTVTTIGAGAVTSQPAGIACGPACIAFDSDVTVTLAAKADAGSTFAGWSAPCTGTGPCVVLMQGKRSFTAIFNKPTQRLTVNKKAEDAGAVTGAPLPSINCGVTCTMLFNTAAQVTLTAIPNASSTFARWSGACQGSGSCQLTMNLEKTVIATFNQAGKQTLMVAREGQGKGSVSSSVPVGIDCGVICTFAFAQNTPVTLIATPVAGSVFGGWSGACTGTSACQVTLNELKTVIATFDPLGGQAKRLLVAKAGAGDGSVASDPSGLVCDPTCSFDFNADSQITLLATPDAGSTFARWSGACSGVGVCLVTMNADRTAIATFNPVGVQGQNLAVARAGTGEGTVTSTPAGVNCGSVCAVGFVNNQPVTLTATAAAGSIFIGWEGDCAGIGPCQVTLDGAKTVIAIFATPAGYLPMIFR